MKQLLILLTAVVAGCLSCNVGVEIVQPYGFGDDANLLCKYLPYSNLDTAEACTFDAFNREINVGIGATCAAGFVLVGYDRYECDKDSGKVAEDLISNSITNPYSACVDENSADICKDPTAVSSTTKLKVVPFLESKIYNVDKVADGSSDIVYYELACDDGYSFAEDVTEAVYGYCSDNANDINVYTFHEGSGADGCYALCPANGEAASISSAVTNLESISSAALGTKNKHGSTISAEVTCKAGYSVEAGAPEQYMFACEGAKGDAGDADSGTYSCGDNCPVCVAMCEANAGPDGGIRNVKSFSYDAAKSGETIKVSVVCEDGFGLSADAPTEYDFKCSGTPEGAANSGTISLADGETGPVCQPLCPADSFDLGSINLASSVSVVEGVDGVVNEGAITCESGHSLPYDTDGKALLTCESDADGAANSGKYTCGESCPVCEPVCAVDAADEVFAFELADGATIGSTVAAGEDIVEVSCKKGKNILGETLYSCKDGTLTFDDAEPVCTDDPVCKPPKVENGKVVKKDNVGVGGKFEIVCNPGFLFDYKTADKQGKEDNRYTEGEWECDGNEFPKIACYRGCLPPDFQGGSTYPDINEEGKAPYEEGATVQFQCLDNSNIVEGKAEAVCDGGQIPSPVCGCDAIFISINLLLGLLMRLL